MSKISPYIILGTMAGFLFSSVEVQAQSDAKFMGSNTSASGEITGYTPKQAGMTRSMAADSAGASNCAKKVKAKGWKTGLNNAGEPNEFAIAIGLMPTEIKPGEPGYIDSRYVAFREAWMVANTEMAKTLRQLVRTEASSRMLPATPNVKLGISAAKRSQKLRAKANQIKDRANQKDTFTSTVDKGMRWVNAKLDEELKKKGIDVQAEQKASLAKNESERKKYEQMANAAAEEAKKLLIHRRFDEEIGAAARERMKGIYSWYVNENIPPGSVVARICVVLKYSKRSESLAEAMASRDFSKVPKKIVETPRAIINQLPDPSQPQGVFELLKRWGLGVMVDENNEINLVAYGQAGLDGKDSNAMLTAKTTADLRARALLRLFINQTANVLENAKIAQGVKSYKNNITIPKIGSKARKAMELGGGSFKKINGIREVLDWQGVHPISSQGIFGVVVAWNMSSAGGAMRARKRQNRIIRDSGGNKSFQKPKAKKAESAKRPPLRRGSFSGSTKSTDF